MQFSVDSKLERLITDLLKGATSKSFSTAGGILPYPTWLWLFFVMAICSCFFLHKKLKSLKKKKEFVYPLIIPHGIWVWFLLCPSCSGSDSDVQCSQALQRERWTSLWEKMRSIWPEIWSYQITMALYWCILDLRLSFMGQACLSISTYFLREDVTCCSLST